MYAAAKVGIVFAKEDNAQRFCLGLHDADITALAVDPSGRFVATGQAGARPCVRVWCAHTGRPLVDPALLP